MDDRPVILLAGGDHADVVEQEFRAR